MATTFQVNEQSDPQNTFADILLSKLNDSKFVNDIVDRVFTLANRAPRTATIQQKPTPLPQTNKEAPKTQVQSESKPQPQALPKQIPAKNEVLTPTKNTVQIADNTQSQKSLETESSNDTLFSRFTKVLERTTSKLEDTVKKVPRPWELTPGTSMGYQMLKGDDSIQENARKGLAQFLGRYATNMHEPLSYGVPKFLEKWTENSSSNKSIIEKLSKSFSEVPFKKILKDEPNYRVNDEFDRDTLYREMFDLPSRFGTKELKKIDNKQYQLSDYKNVNPKDPVNFHPLLGGVHLQKTPDGKSKFNDKWDVVSSDGEDKKYQSLMNKSKLEGLMYTVKELQKGKTSPLRQFLAPLLRPATVSGLYDESDKQYIPTENKAKQPDNQQKFSENFPNNLSKEVSKKIEKIPALSSLTKGLENIKGNKMLEGLKDISAVAPSVKPIVSFLTTNETGTTPETTIGLADTTKTFNNLKDWMKETTITKLNSWSTDLYDWSKDKITSATESIDSVFSGTEKLNSFNANDLKISQTSNDNNIQAKSPLQNFDIDSLKSLVKSVQPDISSLQNKIDNESLTLNNGALDQIVGNTKGTNEAVRTLSEAILRLAQSFNNSNGNNQAANNLYGASTGNSGSAASRRRADIMRNIPGAAQVAATNRDPIKEVRSSFSPKVPPRFARFA